MSKLIIFFFLLRKQKCRISEGTETGLRLWSNRETDNILWQVVIREVLSFILHRNYLGKKNYKNQNI